ncbi:hypothetical protein C9374_012202 [Naegleria lovaniensis]|uniref:Uncharacterized protein n=1 Tax=Naegleria lovaniensis TaxID=51637 RepID=A0AA88GFZ5_NAELO|nr:uncharacterized protein C9374_012202 [Naegleria lovaniensis]KAG2373336.1 hypothetical protein C9374_012202 [Naegleria lovaniensis]
MSAHGQESSVIIESASQSKAYIGVHAASGILSFLVAKGILLVPMQNMKTREQFSAQLISDRHIALPPPWFLGLGEELCIQFSGFFLRVGLNSLSAKWNLQIPSVATSMLSDVITYPLVAKRVRSVVNGYGGCIGVQSACPGGDTWANWLISVGTFVLYGVVEESLSSVIFDNLLSKYLPFDTASSLYAERLAQSLSLGLAKLVLTPLEALYKHQMYFGSGHVPHTKRENLRSLYKGALLGFGESLSLIYFKYAVYKSLSELGSSK